MRLIVEMGGGNRGEEPTRWMEVSSCPDWVKLMLFDGAKSVRLTYGDGSFSEWRLRK